MAAMELSRREVLDLLGALGFGVLAGCTGAPYSEEEPEEILRTPGNHPPVEGARYTSNLRALMDLLLPAERNGAGQIVSPGALEAGAERVLRLENFVLVAKAQGLLPHVRDDFLSDGRPFDDAFARIIEADLDVLASAQRPLTPFRELPAHLMEAAVRRGFDDPARSPLLQFVRAACFFAFLGAIDDDRGLTAVGFPPFDDLAAGVAVSGYPRVLSDGSVDDYTYNLAPAPTPSDDLTGVVDAGGDLV